MQKALSQKKLQNLRTAAEFFSKALELQPNNSDFLRQAGIVQLISLAMSNLQWHTSIKVLQRSKDDKVALGNTGICLIRLRRINEGILNIAKVYKLISTEEDKLEFKNLIKVLIASMPVFGARISQLSITRYLNYDLITPVFCNLYKYDNCSYGSENLRY